MSPTSAISDKDLSMDCHDMNVVPLDNDQMEVNQETFSSPLQANYDTSAPASPILLTNYAGDSRSPFQTNSATTVPSRTGREPTMSVHSMLPCSSNSDISARCFTVPSTSLMEACANEMTLSHSGHDIVSLPRTESTAIDFNEDSLDASDVAFSQ